MTKVITQVEIKEYSGMGKAVFPANTIITPSARDWAREHQIQIAVEGVMEDEVYQKKDGISTADQRDLLRQVVESVISELKSRNASLDKDVVFKAVLLSLERLGCRVE